MGTLSTAIMGTFIGVGIWILIAVIVGLFFASDDVESLPDRR